MAFQSTLKETPFKIVYSRDPPSIRSYEPGETRIAAVAQHMADRDAFLEDVRARLEQAQAIYKRFYNKHHRDVTFPVCDWVWLRLRHRAPASLQVKTSSKLRPRFFGSYKIVTIISPVAYKLELPPRARLHDVFHVGLLKPFKGTPPDAPPALPPIHHGTIILEPKSGVRARVTRGVRYLLVRWKGEPPASATWEEANSFAARFPQFQLKDELLLEGGRDVMWGRRHYNRRNRAGAGQGQPSQSGLVRIRFSLLGICLN
jgi:hypothetical protein